MHHHTQCVGCLLYFRPKNISSEFFSSLQRGILWTPCELFNLPVIFFCGKSKLVISAFIIFFDYSWFTESVKIFMINLSKIYLIRKIKASPRILCGVCVLSIYLFILNIHSISIFFLFLLFTCMHYAVCCCSINRFTTLSRHVGVCFLGACYCFPLLFVRNFWIVSFHVGWMEQKSL